MQPEPQSTPTPFNVPLQSKEVKGKKYNRNSPNRDPRTPYNDILINIRKRVFPMPANYGSLVQNYTLRHFDAAPCAAFYVIYCFMCSHLNIRLLELVSIG